MSVTEMGYLLTTSGISFLSYCSECIFCIFFALNNALELPCLACFTAGSRDKTQSSKGMPHDKIWTSRNTAALVGHRSEILGLALTFSHFSLTRTIKYLCLSYSEWTQSAMQTTWAIFKL